MCSNTKKFSSSNTDMSVLKTLLLENGHILWYGCEKNPSRLLYTDTCSKTAVWKAQTNLIIDLQFRWRTVRLVYWLLSKSAKWWRTPSGSVRTKTRTWLAQCTLHHRDLASMTSWAVTERGALACHSLELNRKRRQTVRGIYHPIIHLAVKECY